MNITSYSVLTAIICFNVLILLFAFFRRKSRVVFYCGMAPLICFCVFSIARTLCVVEFPFTRVVTVQSVNWLYDLFRTSIRLLDREISVGFLVCVAWSSWTAARLWRFLTQTSASARYMRQTVWVGDPETLRFCWQITNGRARLALTERRVPYIAGFFRPAIFIPNIPLSENELRYTFMHEWQHFKNRDQWKKVALHLLICLFWWNPLVYILRFELDQILELNCDRDVLGQLPKEERVAYLRMIGGFYDSGLESGKKSDVLISEIVSLKKGMVFFDRYQLIKQRLWLGMRYGQMTLRQKIVSFLFCVCIAAAFFGSYLINIQPRYEPEELDAAWVDEFPESTVLRENADGSYEVVIDGEDWCTLQDRSKEPFASMPVIPFRDF